MNEQIRESDHELLEFAAKAAGLDVFLSKNGAFLLRNSLNPSANRSWNPLEDDGDALRMAVKLRLWVGQHEDGVTVSDLYARFKVVIEEDHGTDPYAATRLAIVKAAAEIGKEME